MVRPSGKATVVDFGITKGSDERHDITTTGVLFGTPAYMAPEALSGAFDHRSDLYSLGCVLYEMVTGQQPFGGASWQLVHQHLNEQPVPLRSLRPDAPAQLDRLISQLPAQDPADRPARAEETMDTLHETHERCFGKENPSRGQNLDSDVWLSPDEAANGAVIPFPGDPAQALPGLRHPRDRPGINGLHYLRGHRPGDS